MKQAESGFARPRALGWGVAAIALLMVATSAFAAVRLYAARPGNFTAGAAAVLVPLNAAGALSLNFVLPAAATKVLTYSAECTVNAPAGNNFAWVDVDVIVNGVVIPPTVGTSDAFCSADGVAGFGGYTRASITVVFRGVAGVNNVRIVARGNAGATGIWLGDSALVIHD